MADKVYIDDLLKGNTWYISQCGQTQFDTDIQNGYKTHNYCEAIDIHTLASLAPQEIYAPVKMVVKHMNDSSNRMVYESVDPVQFANGVVDYFCLFLCHVNDENEPKYTIGKEVDPGDVIYKEGTKSGSNPTGVKKHIHMQCGRGKFVNVIIGNSGYSELVTTDGDLNPTELFLRTNSAIIEDDRRIKWLSNVLQSICTLVTVTDPITIRTSMSGTSLKLVPKGKSVIIKRFEKKDYDGYKNCTDEYEWARAEYEENGYTYSGFVQLDTMAYYLTSGTVDNVKFSPYYQPVYLRTGLPSLDANGNVVKVETGKVYFAANPSTKFEVNSFYPTLQVDGYCYARVWYNSQLYFVQLDTKKCYVLTSE